jgi:hypothetical protein
MKKRRYEVEYEDENPPEKKNVKGKKLIIFSIFLILIIILSAQILYSYVIPRVTIDFKTTYHEATGGGGTGGIINVNTKFINTGTTDIEDFSITVTILNSTESILINKKFQQDLVAPGDSHEIKLTTNGNCFETFYIILETQFNSDKSEYNEKYLYTTHEDAMNIGFEDTIFEWGF